MGKRWRKDCIGSIEAVRSTSLPFPALLLAGFACACTAGGTDPKESAATGAPAPEVANADYAWDGVTRRSHRDRESALRFPVPVTGYRVTASHFDPSTPPIKLKHELVLEQDRREVVRIDVWNDSEGLGLTGFFDQYLRFMVTPDALVERTRATRRHAEAIVVRHPRSPHALSRRSIVVELDGRIVRVTSVDDDDSRSRSVADGVLDGLESEEAK